MEINARYELGT